MWQEIGAGAAAIGQKAIGSAIDYGFGQLAAGQQASTAKEMYRKRWRWATADMRKAGINPILATKAGPGAAPSAAMGSTGGSPIQMGATAQRFAAAERERAQTGLVEEQTQTEPKRRTLITAQEREADAKVGQLQAEKMATDARRLFTETQQKAEEIRVQRAREELQFAKADFKVKARLAKGIGTTLDQLEDMMGEYGVMAGILAFHPAPWQMQAVAFTLLSLGGPLGTIGQMFLDYFRGKDVPQIDQVIDQLPRSIRKNVRNRDRR